MSFSLYNNDLEVLQFYEAKRKGYFVDIGAGQGMLDSNTYLFERIYDWTGICVEPDNTTFEILRQNRPNSICSNKAVDSMTYESSYILRDESGNETGHVIFQHSTINDILDNNNAPSVIDYVSVNITESFQNVFEILNAIDFTKYRFGLISIFFPDYNMFTHSEIQELFETNGYEFIKIVNGNQWYKASPSSSP
jgi:hypothetical protein